MTANREFFKVGLMDMYHMKTSLGLSTQATHKPVCKIKEEVSKT